VPFGHVLSWRHHVPLFDRLVRTDTRSDRFTNGTSDHYTECRPNFDADVVAKWGTD